MLDDLVAALGEYEADDQLRCALLFAHGEHFTAGLDLANVGETFRQGWKLPKAPSIPGAPSAAGVKQAAGGGRARLLLHHRHRTDAGGRHQPLRQQRALRPARSAARNPPVRWRDTAHAPGRRLGQRHALAAHRRRIRRPRSLSSRPGAGSHRPGGPPRPRRRSRQTGRGPGAARRRAPPSARRARPCWKAKRSPPLRCRKPPGACSTARTPRKACARSRNAARDASKDARPGRLSARPGYWAGRRLSI